jgi:hypothetical protein
MLVIFLVSLSAGQTELLTLLGGAALSALGLLVRRRGAARAASRSGRFQTLRRLLGSEDEPE